MAKNDKEFLNDTRIENKSYQKKNPVIATTETTTESTTETITEPGPNSEPDFIFNASGAAENAERNETNAPTPEPVNSEFKEKFDEYFKGAGSIIAGETIVNIIDDFKANLLFIYAKKSNVDIPKDALKMDEKTRMFSAFLVDHALKNKMLGWVEKNPILAATGVIALSGVSSYMMIEMFKKSNNEAENMKKEIARLKDEAAKRAAEDLKRTVSEIDNNLETKPE